MTAARRDKAEKAVGSDAFRGLLAVWRRADKADTGEDHERGDNGADDEARNHEVSIAEEP